MERKLLIITFVVGFGLVLVVFVSIFLALLLTGERETFRDKLLQECATYRTQIYPSLPQKLDCKRYADLFDAELSQTGSACQAGVFEEFLNRTITSEMFSGRQTILWSGEKAQKATDQLFDSGKGFIPLNRVLAGYIMNNYEVCKGSLWEHYEGCKNCDAEIAGSMYWKSASKRFASLSVGQVNILLESDFTPIVRNQSILATVEVPNLNAAAVTRAELFIYKNCEAKIDQCEEASVKMLLSLLKNRTILSNCQSCKGLPIRSTIFLNKW